MSTSPAEREKEPDEKFREAYQDIMSSLVSDQRYVDHFDVCTPLRSEAGKQANKWLSGRCSLETAKASLGRFATRWFEDQGFNTPAADPSPQKSEIADNDPRVTPILNALRESQVNHVIPEHTLLQAIKDGITAGKTVRVIIAEQRIARDQQVSLCVTIFRSKCEDEGLEFERVFPENSAENLITTRNMLRYETDTIERIAQTEIEKYRTNLAAEQAPMPGTSKGEKEKNANASTGKTRSVAKKRK